MYTTTTTTRGPAASATSRFSSLMSSTNSADAQAAKPEVEKFNEVVTEQDEFLSYVCGFTVVVDGNISGTFRQHADGSVHVTEQGTVVLSANGRTLTNTWRQNFKGMATETFNEDGTLTITFADRFIGMPERWLDMTARR
jgi:hypothetical protein